MINSKIYNYVNRAQLAINDWQCSGEIYYLEQAKADDRKTPRSLDAE